MTLEQLREHIDAVLAYNWPAEFSDALENGPEGHIIEHLIALAEFIGTPISDEDREALYSDVYDDSIERAEYNAHPETRE